MRGLNLSQKAWFFVAVSVAALLLVYIVFSNYYFREQEGELLNGRIGTAAMMSQEFHELFDRGVDRLKMMASLPALVYGLQELEANREGQQISAWTTLHYLVYENDVFLNGIFLVDRGGRILWSEPTDVDLLGTSYPGYTETQAQGARDEESNATFTLRRDPGDSEFLISVPVTDDDGGLVATLIGAIPVDHETVRNILQRNPNGHGAAHLLDDSGRVVSTTDPARAFQVVDYWKIIANLSDAVVTRFEDTHSDDAIVAAAPIIGSPWTIATDQKASEALADIEQLKGLLIGFGLVFTMFAMGSLLFILRSFTKPVEMLTDAARRIGGGDLSVGFNLDRNDELGVLARSLDEMQKKLKSSYELLMRSEKMALMGQVVAGLAHELNNPLTIVIGNIQMMQMREHNEKNQQALTRVKDGADRASRIVKNLLTYARQEKPERKQTDVNTIITKTLDLRVYELKVSNIDVSLDLHAGLPKTMADPHQLQQVFLNLIVNAEQAMIEAHGKGSLHIRTQSEGERILITFSDNGPGIPEDRLHRIFEPFFTTKSVGKGTGLGLSICQGIILEHGGKIDVDSTVGRGTTFLVELPVQRSTPAAAPQAGAGNHKTVINQKKILVVEEEVQIRDLLVDVLKGQGHNVDTVSTGSRALELIGRTSYDLILTDVTMPEISGQELYASIQQHAPDLESRVVFLTGDLMNTETVRFLESTGRAWLGKPFDIEALRRTVAESLS
jgi:signal transduction histidine kinase